MKARTTQWLPNKKTSPGIGLKYFSLLAWKGYSELFKVPVRLVDTAGIENVNIKKLRSTLQEKMLIQTLTALTYSDVALFVVDAKNGIT
jgi:hypothetical protein